MVKELSELRAIKVAYAKLSQSHNEITRLIGRVTGMGTASAASAPRKRGRPVGSVNKAPAAAKRSGGKRFRSTAADVQKAYDLLASKASKDWMTKNEICKAAGYKPAQVAAAWKRLMEGGSTADGKTVKAVLESNGSRGLKGRYRRR